MKSYLKCKANKSIIWVLVIVLCTSLLSGCGSSSSTTDKFSEETTSNDRAGRPNISEENQNSEASTANIGGIDQTSETTNVEKGNTSSDFAGSLENGINNRKEKQQQSENGKKYDDTYFKDYGVNPFKDAQDEPLSTFSLDVDTASYTIARKYINDGSIPPKDAIRVEEFVNYFKRQYPAPSKDMFSIYTEMAPSVFNRGYHMLEVGLQGKEVSISNIKETALTFVIDVSGSMDMDNRLKLVKKSLEILVDQMGEKDRIGIVVYGTTGRKLLEPTSANNKDRIMNAINKLIPEGSTNAAEGLMLGYDMAYNSFIEGGNNRVILCTDGVANQGITKAEDILEKVEDYKTKGITLTTLGFGMDNFNDIFLESLADSGDGNYAYIDTLEEAKKVFIDQLAGTLQVIAKDVKAQIEFDKDSVESYRLIGYENRTLNEKDFRNNNVDAGEVGAGHAVTALYEVKLKSRGDESIGTVRIRYKNPQTNKVTEVSKQIQSSQVCSNFYDATPRFRFITMVAQTAEILKGSPWASNTSLQDVYELLLSDIKNLDMNKEDSEFIDLVRKVINLKTRN
jgi:Ca-activated chloride channel homolog